MKTLNGKVVICCKYGRKIGCKIWSEQQIMEHMVSPRKSHGSHCRPVFPESGKKVWERELLPIVKVCFFLTSLLMNQGIIECLETIKTNNANCPMEAYEEAKASINRLGPELILQRRQVAAINLARAQEALNASDQNIPQTD